MESNSFLKCIIASTTVRLCSFVRFNVPLIVCFLSIVLKLRLRTASSRNCAVSSLIGLLFSVYRKFASYHSYSFQETHARKFLVLIKHCFNGESPQMNKEKRDKHYSESTPSMRSVYKWYEKVL